MFLFHNLFDIQKIFTLVTFLLNKSLEIMSSPKKRFKSDKANDAGAKKKFNYYKNSKRQFLELGCKGFLVTCNFQEKDCIRECYNLLNNYNDELYGKKETINENNDKMETATDKNDDKETEGNPEAATNDSSSGDEEDISETLQNLVKDANKRQNYQFQNVATGANNCIFIKTTLKDPMELGLHIINDIQNSKQKSRNILRFLPIETVCKANISDIINASGKLLDKYFLKEPKTFSIIFNKRYNNDVNRDQVIKELADLVSLKNINHKVNLKEPDLSIIIEIIKGLCLISVLPNYIQLKKYNISELYVK